MLHRAAAGRAGAGDVRHGHQGGQDALRRLGLARHRAVQLGRYAEVVESNQTALSCNPPAEFAVGIQANLEGAMDMAL